MSGSYWGEFKNEKQNENIPDISADIELSMNKSLLNEFDDEEDSLKTEKITVPPLNSNILYAISLHKHTNQIYDLIKLARTNRDSEKVDLKFPLFPNVNSANPALNLTVPDFKNPEFEICELSKTVVRQLLRKSVATLFAHLGYQSSEQSALDVLVDVLEDFYIKICNHLKVAIHDEEVSGLAGFPNVIERVLTEFGMDGVKTLNDFYKCRVVRYNTVLEKRWKDLSEKYEKMHKPESPLSSDGFNKLVRVKVEEEDVMETENNEVHFSTIIDSDVNLSILETGYQLLNSLEAETNLQNVEEMSASESPGMLSTSDDVSTFKRKKFK